MLFTFSEELAKSTDVEPTIDTLHLMAETTNEPESNLEQSTIPQASLPLTQPDRGDISHVSYSAVPLPKDPPKLPDNLPPLIGKIYFFINYKIYFKYKIIKIYKKKSRYNYLLLSHNLK